MKAETWLSRGAIMGIVLLVASAGAAAQGSSGGGSSGSSGSSSSGSSSGSGGGAAAPAAMPAGPALTQVAKVAIPGKMSHGFDISWVDPATDTLFVADHNNAIDVVNVKTGKLEGLIGQGDFAGGSQARSPAQVKACGPHGTGGPDGVLELTVGGQMQLWVGDGVTYGNPVSSVKVFNLTQSSKGDIVASGPPVSIATGGGCRADELAYDAKDHIVAIANDVDNPPFETFISVNTDPTKDQVLGKVVMDGGSGAGHGPMAIDGIEQTVWDPNSDLFYINLPQIPSSTGKWVGAVVSVNPADISGGTETASIVGQVNGCSPGGLALDPNNDQLLLGCSGDAERGDTVNGVKYPGSPAESVIINAKDGSVVNTITQIGSSDEVWYNAGNEMYYTASSGMSSNGKGSGYSTPAIGVINAKTGKWVANVPGAAGSHSIAADSNTNEVLYPITKYGVAILKAS